MSTSNAAASNILVAIDYSEASNAVVEQAVAVAQRNRPCELHFLHVNQFSAEDAEAREGGEYELLEWLGARLPDSEEALAGITVMVHEASGDAAQVIVQTASELANDLIILGTHGRTGLERIVLGSVAEAVSRHAGCSVFVVRKNAQGSSDVEPPCGVCVEERLRSQGRVRWCHDHAARRNRRYVQYGRDIARRVRGSLGV